MGPILVKLYIVLLTCDKFQQRLWKVSLVASIYNFVRSTPNNHGAGNNDTQVSLPEETISKKNLIKNQTNSSKGGA